MLAIFDTCSLLMLLRYYTPFDDKQVLLEFFKQKFDNKEAVLLDAVYEECRFVGHGMVLSNLSFLQRHIVVKTDDLIPFAPKKWDSLLDNQLCIPLKKKLMTDVEYIAAKESYMTTGDAKMLLYARNLQHDDNDLFDKDIVIVTDESRTANDGKPFKKLPVCCDVLGIKSMQLVDYLKINGVRVDWIITE